MGLQETLPPSRPWPAPRTTLSAVRWTLTWSCGDRKQYTPLESRPQPPTKLAFTVNPTKETRPVQRCAQISVAVFAPISQTQNHCE